MKTELQQIQELEARVAKLEQKKGEAKYYMEQALFNLRQAPTMEAFGSYIEHKGDKNESLMTVGFNDRDSYIRQFMDTAKYNMKEALKSEVM